MLSDKDGLYFLTARGKAFYKRLKNQPLISFTGIKETVIAFLYKYTPAENNFKKVFRSTGHIFTERMYEKRVKAANSAMPGCFVPCHGCIDNAIHFPNKKPPKQQYKRYWTIKRKIKMVWRWFLMYGETGRPVKK